MHTLVTEVGKQCKYMGFFLARKTHIFPGLFDQGYNAVYIKNRMNKNCACLIPLLEKIAIPYTVQ